MSSISLLTFLSAFLPASLAVSYYLSRSRYPPGPSGYPVIGNLSKFPLKYPWKGFAKIANPDDVVYYHGLGNSVLVLNSMESINDLLVRKGNIYSSRPYLTMACEIMGLINSTVVMPFGPLWKIHRKVVRGAYSAEKLKQYDEAVSDIIVEFIEALRLDPGDFSRHVHLASGRVLLRTVYGIDDIAITERCILLAKTVQDVGGKAMVPLAFLVDYLPFIKLLPRWLPFMSFYETGLQGRAAVKACMETPFESVTHGMEAGNLKPCFASSVLTDDAFAELRGQVENFEKEVKWMSGSLFVGGQELIAANILKLLAALATNPKVVGQAQDELKRVIGARHPIATDRDNCPYVDAIIKETLRYQHTTPLALFRSSTQDDSYKGYSIPAKTIVIPNIWAIANAPDEDYPPDVFAPERFLKERPPLNPSTYSYGFGRRLCPGKALAETVMFLMTAHILMAFDLSPEVDEKGEEIPINVEYSSGVFSVVSPFQCAFKPRTTV